MATTRYTSLGSAVSYLSTTLNSLANGSRETGGEIDNGAAGVQMPYMMLSLSLGTQTARTGSPVVDIYLLPSHDGTDFAYGDDSLDPSPDSLLCSLNLDTGTAARIMTRYGLQIPPGKFKLLVKNRSSQAFNASGNTLEYVLYSLQST